MLNEAGFYCSGEGKSVPLLLRSLRTVQPWLVIVDTALPPGNIIELADIIEQDCLAAALYINTTGISMNNYVVLEWPVKRAILAAVAETLCSEFTHKKKLRREITALRGKLSERKIIDQAKGIVARIFSLSEEEAYNYLRKKSMESRITMAEVAALIIANPDSFYRQSPLR
ncbi:MAG: ANTAR domain-containing protein [Bacillota bacterium]|nr:ANTAR domain-containing protein [Bacillota bacterium]